MFKVGIFMCEALEARLMQYADDCQFSGNEMTRQDIQEITATFLSEFKDNLVTVEKPGGRIEKETIPEDPARKLITWIDEDIKIEAVENTPGVFTSINEIPKDITEGIHTLTTELTYESGEVDYLTEYFLIN